MYPNDTTSVFFGDGGVGHISPPEQECPTSGGQGTGSLASCKMGSSVLPGKILFRPELFWFKE